MEKYVVEIKDKMVSWFDNFSDAPIAKECNSFEEAWDYGWKETNGCKKGVYRVSHAE